MFYPDVEKRERESMTTTKLDSIFDKRKIKSKNIWNKWPSLKGEIVLFKNCQKFDVKVLPKVLDE